METILRMSEPVEDADGNLLDSRVLGDFEGVVFPLSGKSGSGSDTSFSTATISDGNSKQLQVLAPPGTTVNEGDILRIRGLDYRVKYIPWDWSHNRRPVLARHTPRVQIVCDRKEA